jgi:PST family polysaccharide transporter
VKVESSQVTTAVKWSFLTEIVVKLISPITSMILARLLTPSVFGIVASIVMITSFADIFTDAGFQKYLIQHQFSSEQEEEGYISVAFWSNLAISLFLYGIIFFNAKTLATLVGIAGYQTVIRVYALIIVLTSFSSIQFAVYRKNFQYKKLGIIRIVVKCVPLLVTVPLTFYTRSYWALVIGNLSGEAVSGCILTLWSEYRIRWFYRVSYLKKMFAFCISSLLDSLSYWLVSNISIFMIGQYLGSYYLGLYKTSITTVAQMIAIIIASTMNVLFATLSRQQEDEPAFRETFCSFQKAVGLFTIPLGVGIFVFRYIITRVLLGLQWMEAGILIGLWGFVISESIIFSDMGGIVISAKGKQIYTFFSNMIQALLLAIVLYWVRGKSFTVLSFATFFVRWQLTVTHFGIALKVGRIRLSNLPKELIAYGFSALFMGGLGMVLQRLLGGGVLIGIVEIFLCMAAYFVLLFLFPLTRSQIVGLFQIIRNFFRRKQ